MPHMARLNAVLFSAATLFMFTAFIGAQAPAAPPPRRHPVRPGRGARSAAGRPGGGAPGTESGWATFQGQCFRCHGNPPPTPAPTAWAIRQMTPGAHRRRR